MFNPTGLRLDGMGKDMLLPDEMKTLTMKTTKSLFGILTITTALAVQIQAQSFLTNGLVAYYPFNGNLKDNAGTNDMFFVTIPSGLATLSSDTIYTNQGTFGFDRFGNSTNAISFDGTNMSYARSQSIFDASITNNFTMTIWALAQSTNNWSWTDDGCVLLMPIQGGMNYGGGNAGVGVSMNYNTVGVVGHSDGYAATYLSTNAADGVWHQVTVSCSNSVINLFVDGTLIGESDQSSSGYTLHPSSGWAYEQNGINLSSGGGPCGGGIGGYVFYDGNDGYIDGFSRFQGQVSDLRIYNRALSSDEAAQLYAIESQPQTPPTITNQPQSILVNAHGTATFSVAATGTDPLVYQWKHNGTNVPNATSSTLAITNARPFNVGAYRVVITNNYGAVTSAVANLTLNPNYQNVQGPFLNLSIAATLSEQNISTVNGGITTTASPKLLKLATTDILNMLAFDECKEGNWPSNSFAKNSKLVIAGGTPLVLNSTNILLDVSDIMKLVIYQPAISYGKKNNSTGLATPSLNQMQMASLTFDDTFISGGKNFQFYLAGILTETTTDTTPLRGKYTETITWSLGTAAGDGAFLGVPFTCTGSFSATASNSKTLNP